MANRKKVVAIGGGTGLPAVLRGLKKYPVDITAIVTVADDGGSSGMLRNELQIPPPGDIRNVLVSLSDIEPVFEKLLQHRFRTDSGLNGHSLGNLLIAALTSITGDFVKGVREMSHILNVHGEVLPAADQSIVLGAVMNDGSIVEGESRIPQVNKKIKRVFLKPDDIRPLPESVKAIREADMITLGPGSLYTSVVPNLLVPGLAAEICRSGARKVYVCNVMTQKGETDGFSASDHVAVMNRHVGKPFIDTIIVNNKPIAPDILKRYAAEDAEPVSVDREKLEAEGINVISAPLIKTAEGVIRHNEAAIASLLMTLFSEKKV
ncbi:MULTISPECIES: gluconeogenesis factor YvcK family protein [unclassified Sporolactobacillus]|uniref:gluconeogenesis factor YvcK family protein n=1 Tax=unclassified Sporolactobacillus TaxID=2628533 RepID=UPI002368AC35|nr:YvcK family protein [Sporolactobacillus sp. CQH2019]MDD9148095.1 YvcK family protein [Sporolactobacillus sp. CQH2019]